MSGIVGQNAGRDSGVVGAVDSTVSDNAIDETKLKDALVADFTEVTVTASDSILLGDATDGGNTKRDTVQGILDLATVSGLTNSSNTTWMTVSADEEVSLPLQPCFNLQAAAETDQTGDGTIHTANFTTETFDIGGNFASKQFTAPITGKYLLCVSLMWAAGGYGTTDAANLTLSTSNRPYVNYIEQTNHIRSMETLTLSHVCDMDAGDVAQITWYISGGSKVADHAAGANTNFTGCLLT